MTKKQTVELLEKQLPGFYSVEQVIEMINKIEEGESSFGVDQLEELIDKITSRVEGKLNKLYCEDFVDLDSAEFELNGNEISLSSVELNTSTVVDEVIDAVRDEIFDFFPSPVEA